MKILKNTLKKLNLIPCKIVKLKNLTVLHFKNGNIKTKLNPLKK